LQNPSKTNADNLNNVRHETSRTFRKKEFLKEKIYELETNSKNKNIRDLHRGIKEFKKGYQPIINTVKDENGCTFSQYTEQMEELLLSDIECTGH
jgi:predicted transcriptional regulator